MAIVVGTGTLVATGVCDAAPAAVGVTEGVDVPAAVALAVAFGGAVTVDVDFAGDGLAVDVADA